MGIIDELWKRKREKEKWAFEKSRKVERSLKKEEEQRMAGLMREVKKEMRELKDQGRRNN